MSFEQLMLTEFNTCEVLYSINDLLSISKNLSKFPSKRRSANAFVSSVGVLRPLGGVGGGCFVTDILCCGNAKGSYAGTSSTNCIKIAGEFSCASKKISSKQQRPPMFWTPS